MACAHVSQCFNGAINCTTVGINCATVGMGFDCVAECVNNTPCAMLGMGTITTCEQMCKDAGPGGDAATDSPSPMACQNCVESACQSQAITCGTSQACAPWLQCINNCYQGAMLDPACFENCNTQNPNAAGDYDAIYACACSSCSVECAMADPCSFVADGGPGEGGTSEGGADAAAE